MRKLKKNISICGVLVIIVLLILFVFTNNKANEVNNMLENDINNVVYNSIDNDINIDKVEYINGIYERNYDEIKKDYVGLRFFYEFNEDKVVFHNEGEHEGTYNIYNNIIEINYYSATNPATGELDSALTRKSEVLEIVDEYTLKNEDGTFIKNK